MAQRIWQLDFYRGLVLVLMIIFNWSFLLNYLGVYSLAATDNSLYWDVFPRIIVALFCLISGISLTISYDAKKGIAPYVKRSLTLFACALGVSVVTWAMFPDSFIIFGILHFMALAGLLAYFFIKYVPNNITILLAGLMIITVGFAIANVFADNNALLIFGLRSINFSSLDYEPLLPWFGFILLGIFLGRTIKWNETLASPFEKAVCWLGKNTLTIYLIHQPLLIALLLLFGIRIA